MSGKAVIKRERRVFDGFFKIDEFDVAFEGNHHNTVEQTRLVFERGDAVAALLLNLDTKSAVLVKQFKLPALVGRRRDDASTTNGWIVDTVAGMIDPGETPEAAIIRETMEETGYRIRHPRLIAKFLSSPGGTSERIFLYFAEVRESDKLGQGGGIDDENIELVSMSLEELFDQLASGSIDDPKLIIAAYWLQGQVSNLNDRRHLINTFWHRGGSVTSEFRG
jgi:nudix-type nucleoside diphosphatase (YffH/AdpP family)